MSVVERRVIPRGEFGIARDMLLVTCHISILPSTMASTSIEIFDSLPYYDDDLEKYPGLQDKVDYELSRQPKPPTTMHPHVPPPFELFKVCNARVFSQGLTLS